MKRRAIRRKQSGQGTIELLLTFFAFFTVAFMYFQIAMGFGVANYIQYVTFMSARALLSSYTTEAAQKAAAKSVLEVMLNKNGKDRFGGIAKGDGDGEPAGAVVGRGPKVTLGKGDARETAWQQGVQYKFKIKMYFAPMVPGAKRGEANTVKLTSETWLGRDPSEEECLTTLKDRKTRSGVGDGPDFLYDNGC